MMSRLRPTGATPRQSDSFAGRKKVTLAPNHSLMDWIRLGRSQGDMSGVGPNKINVTPGDLAVHNTQKDLWMAVHGKVYNLTPYIDYHPGGVDELMRAAGKNGTELFDEVHNWVNAESMLEKCLVGTLLTDSSSKGGSTVQSLGSSGFLRPMSSTPSHDWYQNKNEIAIVVYPKWDNMRHDLVIVDSLAEELIIELCIRDSSYIIHLKPRYRLKPVCKVKVSGSSKVEIVLQKEEPNIQWDSLGKPLSMHESFQKTKFTDCRYRQWTVLSNTLVTHDTRLMSFKAPDGIRMVTPVGYHIHIRTNISGMEIARSYTVVVPSLLKPFSDEGVLDGKVLYLMIKSYKGGVISPWVTALKAGDPVMMSNFVGNFDIKRLETTSYLVMFAAGTGFTSMIPLIVHSLYNMTNATFPVRLVFYNKTQKDILWRDQLTELEKLFPRFTVTHILSQENDSNWKGLLGRVTLDHVKKFVPTPKDTPRPLFCISGQWAYNDAVESFGKLNGLGEEHIYVFTQT